jgi:hypothetical protein
MVDNTFLHFGYDKPVKQKTTLYVSVKVMGSVADVDRPVSAVLVDSLSTATLGRNVELLSALSLVPAGETTGHVVVRFRSTTALAAKPPPPPHHSFKKERNLTSCAYAERYCILRYAHVRNLFIPMHIAKLFGATKLFCIRQE